MQIVLAVGGSQSIDVIASRHLSLFIQASGEQNARVRGADALAILRKRKRDAQRDQNRRGTDCAYSRAGHMVYA